MWHTIPALLFLLLAMIFLYALETPDMPQEAPAVAAAKDAPALDILPLRPDVTLPPIAMLENTPVLVNFFASWCTPCLAEYPLIQALSKRGDVLLYGIGWNDTADNLSAFLGEHGNPYTHVGLDEAGRTAIAYGITGVPETFLIDPQHRIVYHLRGPLTQEAIDTRILPLLEKYHD